MACVRSPPQNNQRPHFTTPSATHVLLFDTKDTLPNLTPDVISDPAMTPACLSFPLKRLAIRECFIC